MSIAKEEFKSYILRSLGSPVVKINITAEQLEDRVNEAIQYYTDHHFDGLERIYMRHVITEAEIASRSIAMPDPVHEVVRVIRHDILSTGGDVLGNPVHNLVRNELPSFTSTSLISYDLTMKHFNLIREFFEKAIPIRFNKAKNTLELDVDWSEMGPGDVLLLEVYRALDPEVYFEIYNDRWLKQFAIALVKRQWGTNMKKFDGVTLPGGITLNGKEIRDEANEEIAELKENLFDEYTIPPDFFIG